MADLGHNWSDAEGKSELEGSPRSDRHGRRYDRPALYEATSMLQPRPSTPPISVGRLHWEGFDNMSPVLRHPPPRWACSLKIRPKQYAVLNKQPHQERFAPTRARPALCLLVWWGCW